MNDETEKMLHDLRGMLSVIWSFLSAVEKMELPEDIRTLHNAAMSCMEKMKAMLERCGSDNYEEH